MALARWQDGRSFETDTEKELEEIYNREDLPVSAIQSEFDRASYYLSLATDHLIRAAKDADPYGCAAPIDELIEALDDEFDGRMRKVIKKLKEGA